MTVPPPEPLPPDLEEKRVAVLSWLVDEGARCPACGNRHWRIGAWGLVCALCDSELYKPTAPGAPEGVIRAVAR
jgi:hypothetical protein